MKRFNKGIKTIIEAIQDKKGKQIRVLDLKKIDDTICQYIVICEGNTPTQVSAITDSIENKLRDELGERPLVVDGTKNNLWVAMDYANIIIHIFVPESRAFYDIDHLWEDANSTDIPDLE